MTRDFLSILAIAGTAAVAAIIRSRKNTLFSEARAGTLRKLHPLGYLMATVGGGVGLAGLYLFIWYANTQPQSPNPAAGRTIELNDHGHIVYLTAGQDDLLTCLTIFGVTVAILGGLLIDLGGSEKTPQ